MLNLIYTPQILTFSDNPIPLIVEGGAAWQNPNPAQPWEWTLTFASNDTLVGETITITLFGVEMVIKLVAGTPDDTGLEAKENGVGGAAIDDWLTNELIVAASQNYMFQQWLTFTVVAPDQLIISAPHETSLQVATTIASATAALTQTGAPAEYPPNYNVLAKIEVAPNLNVPVYGTPVELRGVPEKDAPWKVKFDLSPIAKANLRPKLPLTIPLTNITVAELGGTALMRATITEGWGNPPVYRGAQEIPPVIIAKGGLPFHHYPDAGNTYIGTASARFLTWMPQDSLVSQDQRIYLYWLCYYNIAAAATQSVTLYAKKIFADGSSATKNFSPAYTAARFQSYIVPGGYKMLGLHTLTPTTGKPVSYEVGLLNANGYFTGMKQTFILDYRCNGGRSIEIVFANSLGGFDTLRTTTNATTGIKVSRETFSQFMEVDYPYQEGDYRTFQTTARKTIRVNTGWVSKDYIKYLHEFAVSQEMYVIEEDKFLPIQLLTDSFQLYRNDAMLYALEFEYEYRFDQSIYAPSKLIPV